MESWWQPSSMPTLSTSAISKLQPTNALKQLFNGLSLLRVRTLKDFCTTAYSSPQYLGRAIKCWLWRAPLSTSLSVGATWRRSLPRACLTSLPHSIAASPPRVKSNWKKASRSRARKSSFSRPTYCFASTRSTWSWPHAAVNFLLSRSVTCVLVSLTLSTLTTFSTRQRKLMEVKVAKS